MKRFRSPTTVYVKFVRPATRKRSPEKALASFGFKPPAFCHAKTCLSPFSTRSMKLLISAVGFVAFCWLTVWLLLTFGSRPVGMKDMWDFKVSIKDGSKRREVHVEGLINSGSYVFKDAAFDVNNGKLNIIIRGEYTRARYSGSFSVTKNVVGDFNEAVLMPEGTIIWRERGQ